MYSLILKQSVNYTFHQFSRKTSRCTKANFSIHNALVSGFSSRIQTPLHLNASHSVLHSHENKLLLFPVRLSSSDKDFLVCYNELRKLRKSNKVLLIDVRNHGETWRTGTIPGSLCIPANEVKSAINMTPEKFKKTYCRAKPNTFDNVVFICRRGPRSYKITLQARKMGFKNAKAYKGGFISWFDQERIKREIKAAKNTGTCDKTANKNN
ncbi:thiosulfate sulfurtransferase/rhodanese-like domain-containing protein 3 isoform X2 [Homalodisca vitripennis]|uniref:thiosulfate sulfurtransferase/rhodanese-like domain-containing protein 3 isoform X2 n=1 Tax=Homalodisca vitripennis TaxID=197043 RepID=UPI001EECBFC0|nr:thiosulfate sulfurtransferase/rhodanese-like domain-containing protein 3 isoform X2 [Homalodisca vitripennis]